MSPRSPRPRGEADLRQLRGLARARLAADDDDLMVADRARDFVGALRRPAAPADRRSPAGARRAPALRAIERAIAAAIRSHSAAGARAAARALDPARERNRVGGHRRARAVRGGSGRDAVMRRRCVRMASAARACGADSTPRRLPPRYDRGDRQGAPRMTRPAATTISRGGCHDPIRPRRHRSALALAAALALPALDADAKTLRWAGRGDMQTTDPHSQNENLTNNINQLVYEFLLVRDKKLEPAARARRIVDQGQSDDVALQAAARRQVPRRHAVHRRRRRVQLRARALRHVAAARLRQRVGHPEEDRRPDGRVHDQRPQSDRARAHRDDQHHEQGVVREEPRDEAAELHAEGGHDHRAPGERHRAVHAEDARARREDGARQESRTGGASRPSGSKATPTR